MEKREKRYRITIRDTGESYICREGQHLLKGMASMGKRGIPSGCHGGGCGVCLIRILAPKSAYRTQVMSRDHVSEEDEVQGIVLACRAYPLQDLEVEVIGKIRKNVLRKKTSGWTLGQPVKVKK
jgi:ferredoxin